MIENENDEGWHRMNGLIRHTDMIITPEKAATVARLEAMRADNWRALDGMDADELSELEAQVTACAVVLADNHPHNAVRRAAYAAIRQRKQAIAAADIAAKNAQHQRAANIADAAGNIRNALEMLDRAWKVEYKPDTPTPLPDMDVSTASDHELTDARIFCQNVLNAPSRHAEHAELIANLKTDAARGICKELKDQAQADAKRRADAAKLLEAIDSEIKRRMDEQAERDMPLAERVAKLEALIYRNGGEIAE